jgi:hypothetical protein
MLRRQQRIITIEVGRPHAAPLQASVSISQTSVSLCCLDEINDESIIQMRVAVRGHFL